MFYGRKYELKIIENAISSPQPELGIIYGRRRVGKSSLLQQPIKKKTDLYFEALQKAPFKKQINHFLLQLANQTQAPRSFARDWREAFDALSFHIKTGRHYVVFDEFPWMASNRSELVSLLKFYWDNQWKKNPGLTLVLCGSIASFMLRHIVHSQALHNRKTFEISLDPLPALEAKQFFRGYRSDFETAKFLMVFGGIPKYLEQINPKLSFANNMDKLCFQKNGFFVNEFETIFKEQFKVTKNYESIARTLALKSCSKEEISRRLHIPSGGGLSGYLHTLEQADFIKTFAPKIIPGKNGEKTKKIVLWDEWLRFYFTYMDPYKKIIRLNTKPGLFDKVTEKSIENYFGKTFEALCMKNLPLIINNLGYDISQIINFGPFFRQRHRSNKHDRGLQIDILLHKKGNVLILFECKFSTRPITASVISEVQQKIQFLKAPRHYTVERVLISAGDVTPSVQNSDYFHHIIGIEDVLNEK